MWVRTYDQVSTPVCKVLRQSSLRICDGMAVFYAPVHTHHHKICKLTCRFYLQLDHIGSAILLASRVRPKFIGGVRAVYDQDLL